MPTACFASTLPVVTILLFIMVVSNEGEGSEVTSLVVVPIWWPELLARITLFPHFPPRGPCEVFLAKN